MTGVTICLAATSQLPARMHAAKTRPRRELWRASVGERFVYESQLKAVKAALGEGHPSHKYSDVYFVEYRPQGIEISFNSSDDTVHAIYFYNRQQGSEQFGVFCGQTDKGVNWKSTVDDVKSLYGHPSADFMQGNAGRLEFTGIDFRFENGNLVRIGVPGR